MMKYSLGLLLFCALTFSCKNKKINQTPVAEVITEELDTIHIVATKTPEKKIYQASNSLPNDLLHTRLEVNFDWAARRLNGKATLKLKPWFYPVQKLALNARGMEIRSVEVFEVMEAMESGAASKKRQQKDELRRIPEAAYVYEEDSLKISLGRSFSRFENYYVVVEYVARPDELPSVGGSAAITEDKGLYFVNPQGENPFKMPQIWTQGETQANSVWFPTIDSPNEKMTQEIFMTVDDKYTTLSNGKLVKSEKNADGTRTDHWQQELPHAPYLTMMAVGEFVKVTGEPWEGKEISYYVEKEYAEHAREIFAETKDMIDFYSRRLEVPYPWDKYAQIVARDYVSGAMENTSATLHGDFMVYQTSREIIDGRRGTAVIAHELFHQWFGDLVTCESWSNLPLNESFATYGEYLWYEHRYGRDAADEHSWQSRMGYIHSRKEADLIRYYYKDKEDMFDAISYNKGGQVLHMLRKAVGDEAFFQSLKKYLNDNKFQPVEIHHLRLAFEEITGRDMNWFFNQWFLNKGRPKLTVTRNYNATTNTLELLVSQLHDTDNAPLYTLPLEIDVYVNGEVERTRILIDDRLDTFRLKVKGAPQLVNFDAERQLLADITYEKSPEELRFQYKNAPLFIDRLEALQNLLPTLQDSAGFQIFSSAATGDPNATIRKYALGKLSKAGPSYDAEVKTLLTGVYQKDKETTVRALALELLNNRFRTDEDVKSITTNALTEKSYAICAEALNAIAKSDPARALNAARVFEDEKGKDIIFAVATIYANHGADQQISFFRNSIKYVTGFDMLQFCVLYSRLAQRCEEPANAVAAASDLGKLGSDANKYTKYAVTKALKDILKDYTTKESNLIKMIENDQKDGKPTGSIEKELRDVSEARSSIKMIYEKTTNQ